MTRESGYNPRASSRGNLGLMQIKYATARGVGYTGSPSGLMDPETNLTYAVRYLAGAYRAAGGNARRAVSLYASGYHRRGVPDATRVAATPWSVTQTTWGQWYALPVALGRKARRQARQAIADVGKTSVVARVGDRH